MEDGVGVLERSAETLEEAISAVMGGGDAVEG
jgi:hypothetical protein